MLIPKDKLQAIYDHMKQKVQAAEGSVLICVAGETDAMAGSHIFMVCCPRPYPHCAPASLEGCAPACLLCCPSASVHCQSAEHLWLSCHFPAPSAEPPGFAACCTQSMLQADNVAYSMSAVRGIDDIVEKVDEVDQDTCHTVVLLNCGAGEDIIGIPSRVCACMRVWVCELSCFQFRSRFIVACAPAYL